MKRRRLLNSFLRPYAILGIILFIVLGGLWLWKVDLGNKVPVDWKTYENQQFGFTFKYPPNWYWEINPDAGTENNISFFLVGEEADHSYGDHSGNEIFSISIQKDSRTLTELKNNYYKSATETQIDGKQAIKTEFDLYLLKLDEENILHIVAGKPRAIEYKNLILSTLHFSS